MPRGNGTGPPNGRGQGAGRGIGKGRDTGRGTGPGGQCVCPSCGATAAHQAGVPCAQMSCSKCGAAMMRK